MDPAHSVLLARYCMSYDQEAPFPSLKLNSFREMLRSFSSSPQPRIARVIGRWVQFAWDAAAFAAVLQRDDGRGQASIGRDARERRVAAPLSTASGV